MIDEQQLATETGEIRNSRCFFEKPSSCPVMAEDSKIWVVSNIYPTQKASNDLNIHTIDRRFSVTDHGESPLKKRPAFQFAGLQRCTRLLARFRRLQLD